ncbi:MAG: cytochrome C oxidase subunit IV family protein [Limisphaerales bacterium]
MKTKIPPRNVFIAIWFALQLLLFSMLGLAQFNFKLAGTILILTFAVVQMFLVLLFFMRLRQCAKLIWFFAAAGFFWLLIMFTLTFSDYLTRQWH